LAVRRAGERRDFAAFALTLRVPEDDPHRSAGVPPDRLASQAIAPPSDIPRGVGFVA